MQVAEVKRNRPETTKTTAAPEAKAELFRRAYRGFAGLYEPGDLERFPWLDEGLREVEDQADGLSVEEIRGRLRELYLRYKRAKQA